MTKILLIVAILAVFALGYFIVKKWNDFFTKNQRIITEGSTDGSSQIRIAAEAPDLLKSIAPVCESCTIANPHLNFSFSSGKAQQPLRKLLDGMADIALLSEESAKNLGSDYTAVQIPFQDSCPEASYDMVAKHADKERPVYIVWNKKIKSKDRDSVVFALENEHCKAKCGYRDYLD